MKRGWVLTYIKVVYIRDMLRTQILLPESMLSWLRDEALRRGVSVSEVVRSLVQEHIDRK